MTAYRALLLGGILGAMGTMAVALSGCVGNAPAAVSSACAWIKPIHPSRQDTIETLRQIDEQLKAIRANCPGTP